MEKEALRIFVNNYIQAWSTTNPEERKLLVEKVYTSFAEFYANEPEDDAVAHQGVNKIFENISQVNKRLVVGSSLITECTGYSENHNTVRVTWQMKAPDGNIAMKGMNFLQLNHSDKILKDYIFIS